MTNQLDERIRQLSWFIDHFPDDQVTDSMQSSFIEICLQHSVEAVEQCARDFAHGNDDRNSKKRIPSVATFAARLRTIDQQQRAANRKQREAEETRAELEALRNRPKMPLEEKARRAKRCAEVQALTAQWRTAGPMQGADKAGQVGCIR